MTEFSHIDEQGKVKMVDLSQKTITARKAIATGRVIMKPATLEMIKNSKIEKGAVLQTAKIAGIMGVKKTSEIIPMCHPLLISSIKIEFEFEAENKIKIKASVKNSGKTGVEMEALNGVTTAALTIYDMCKAVDKEMTIENIQLEYKSGGKSGIFKRD
ncbi:MAG: cyclic pyranopterin monophosphate synthase MoaC [Bacillota bacterium]